MTTKHPTLDRAKRILASVAEAIDISKGNAPDGTRITFVARKQFTVDTLSLPPGRYEIRKLGDVPLDKAPEPQA